MAALSTGSSEMRRWWRLWWDRVILCAVHRSQWRLCCDKGMTKQSVLVRRNLSQIWTRKNLTTFGLQLVTTLFERGTECEYIHSKGNCPLFQMPYLAKSYDASVVSYLAWKLGVTFFLNHPVYSTSTMLIMLKNLSPINNFTEYKNKTNGMSTAACVTNTYVTK